MKVLRNLLDRLHPLFDKGGKFERLYPLYEAGDTFLYTPGLVTRGLTHVRDALDLKRMMSMVVAALIPCVFMALWNTGYQANLAIEAMQAAGLEPAFDWHHEIHAWLGRGHNPRNLLDNLVYGGLFFLPVDIVTLAAGGTADLIFSLVRKHEINEGFLVSSLLFPLILPPDIPLWQVAVGILFGVVIGKEVFGGTGRNFLNPALTARAFLYFAYAGEISGDKVWTAVDGFSGATPLGQLANVRPGQFDNVTESLQRIVTTGGEQAMSWWSCFLGTIPGSMGETSVLACLIGAAVLIATGIGSWRIMAGCCLGALALSSVLYLIPNPSNPIYGIAPWWHFAIGGFAFGTVFMATDPVSGFDDRGGQVDLRCTDWRHDHPDSIAQSSLPRGASCWQSCSATPSRPLIDYFVVQANIKRRAVRYAA